MAGFVRAAVKEKAQDLLDRESRSTLSQRDFAAFASAIKGAFTRTRNGGFITRWTTVFQQPTLYQRALVFLVSMLISWGREKARAKRAKIMSGRPSTMWMRLY